MQIFLTVRKLSGRLKLVDSNVWLALAIPGHAHHVVATSWFLAQQAPGEVLFCRTTQQSFLRLLSTKAVLLAYHSRPLTNAQAWEIFDTLVNDPRVGFLPDNVDLESTWKSLSAKPTPSPKLWMDAYLAALAISTGNQLVTIDRDFLQFPGLDLVLL